MRHRVIVLILYLSRSIYFTLSVYLVCLLCLLVSLAVVFLYLGRYDLHARARLAILHRLYELYKYTSCDG